MEGAQQACLLVPLGALTNPTLNEEDMVVWQRAAREGNSVCQDPLKHVVDNITVDTNLLESDCQNVKFAMRSWRLAQGICPPMQR